MALSAKFVRSHIIFKKLNCDNGYLGIFPIRISPHTYHTFRRKCQFLDLRQTLISSEVSLKYLIPQR
ncbi:hypothetical protein PNOK_0950100 [Pyrrhoderma noxium]|uniref:Uncharacterized protein n=1 Tax=Pyrrhoderma noxium TaxID=2282107 RepID=A0A286U5U5_9AGAM|nr:hypothetical protein PNOK_0950100 [Pyrrhoderma noxium]